MSRFIKFKDLKESKISLVGKRAVILSELYKEGFPVQKGIIIPSRLFKEFLVESDLHQEFFSKLRSGLYEEAQELLINKEFPESLAREITSATKQLEAEEYAVSLSSPFSPPT